MAKRRDSNQHEYNPLDDAKGRLPIDADLVRDVMAAVPPVSPNQPARTPIPIFRPAPAMDMEEIEADGESMLPPAPIAPAGYEDRNARRKPLALEKLTKYNKFLTTPREKIELERLAARLSGALGVSVKPSQMIRACLIYLLHAENHIVQRAERQGPVKRPSNTEAVALAEFDHVLAEILSQGFRQAGVIKAKQ